MKRTSIKDVALAANVSITTVSHALNGFDDVSEKTREKIVQIAEQLNYAPNANARSLGGITETTIALLVSDLQPKDESGFAFGIISGLYSSCVKYGCEFMLIATNAIKQEKITFLQLCRKKNVDGIVVMGLRMDDPYYEEVLHSKIPCALIDIETTAKNTCTISVDNVEASKRAVSYLIETGHRKIAMMNGEEAAAVSKDRYQGYAQALLEKNIELDSQIICYGDFKEDEAYKQTLSLLQKNRDITAIFCASDLMAIGVIKAIKSLNMRVPEDISVVGFDDIPISSYIYGGITTVKQDPYYMGQMSGGAVYKMLTKEKGAADLKAPYEFIVRGTTKARI